jgi:hypothetical protein
MRILHQLRTIRFSVSTIPFFLFGLAFFAFGLLTTQLGLFQDDWHHVYFYLSGDIAGLKDFLLTDSRPFAYLVYGFLFKLLGVNLTAWHIYSFIVRFAVAYVAWLCLNQLWQHPKENALISALFLVYPTFLLQSMAVAYALHWLMYLVFMLSILCTLLALKNPKYYLVLTALAVLLEAFHLLMIEYFVGLEIARVLFIWLTQKEKALGRRALNSIKLWLPYLLILILYVVFRSSYAQIFGFDRNTPVILLNLLSDPLGTLRFFIEAVLQDLTELIVSGWYEVLKPEYFSFDYFSRILIWVLTLTIGLAAWFYFQKIERENASEDQGRAWANRAIWVGLLVILFGSLPTWATGRMLVTSNPLWGDRLSLSPMLGAAILISGLIIKTVTEEKYRTLCFSILICLAIGLNLRTELAFKQSWEKQTRFYWQLFWRAPYLEPGTALLSESEFLGYMGHYPTAFAINALYPKTTPASQLDYWFFVGQNSLLSTWADFRSGVPLSYQKYSGAFKGNSLDTLTVTFEPEKNQCLWVLKPQDKKMESLPAETRESLQASNLGRIQAKALQGGLPNADIFGEEPEHSWCYFYEKAELARQEEDWQAIVELWTQAQENGFRPKVTYEFLPFIDGFFMSANWDKVLELTQSASRLDAQMGSYFCGQLFALEKNTLSSAERDSTIRTIREELSCSQ